TAALGCECGTAALGCECGTAALGCECGPAALGRECGTAALGCVEPVALDRLAREACSGLLPPQPPAFAGARPHLLRDVPDLSKLAPAGTSPAARARALPARPRHKAPDARRGRDA